MKTDTKAAVEFLRLWSPAPWALTAIQTDRKAISTRTFHNLEAAEKWIEEFNGVRNIYFHVNPLLHDVTKKAEREDVARVSWLHVDIDPRAGEDIETERERALALLTTKLPRGVPRPSVVVFSGGGYQGFWRLEDPIEIAGDLSRAEDAKRYNQQLEYLFGADNCHNIDRIMRLPGTVNIPDAKKIKKGRKPELARVVHFEETAYALSEFTPAPAVQSPDDKGFHGPIVHVPGNLERLGSVDDLDQWNVPDRVKVVIVQGRHPDEPKKGDDSRSAWLFDVLCQLIRHEVPDDVIFSIILDKDFGISESVLEKGSNAERYAARQLARAKEEVVEPWLRELNEKFAVIGNIGGKCRVIEEVMDAVLDRTKLTRQSFEDFRNRFMNKKVQIGVKPDGGPVFAPVGKWWLEHPLRRQFDTIVFAPEKEVRGAYNLWRGFAVAPRPGDFSLFLHHIENNVCGGRRVVFEYLMKWLARAVQQPASPGEVAIVLRGGRGTGKSFFAKVIGRLFGRHFIHISNPSHLVGNFNAHLRDVVLLFADEAFFAGDKKHASILKTLVTEETLQIESKGVDVETCPNYVHLIMASNDQHVVPAGGDERRFLVLEVGREHQQDVAYFDAIDKQMEAGGYEALLHYLMNVDVERFNVRTAPGTVELRDQKQLSYSTEEEWWYQKLVDGRLLRKGEGWSEEVRKDEIVDDYVFHMQRFSVSRRGTQTALGKFLREIVPGLRSYQATATWEEPTLDGYNVKVTRRAGFYKIAPLAKCRARWEERYGVEAWEDEPALGDPF